jgi:2,3-bisphosphoglycerate-dependent phosphoglycerate mutase
MFYSKQPDGPYNFTLLRHGQSVGNAQGYYQGQSDFPLDDTGKAQAKALARRWQDEFRRFDLAITSPLSRAHQTAEIVTNALGVPLEEDPLWMERDIGILSGLHQDEIAERHPRPDFMIPYQHFGEHGESQWDLYLRAGQAVQSLIERPPGDYLVVSHGGILNMALYAILGIIPQANFQGTRFRFRNTSFARLVYLPDKHVWWLESFGDHRHLEQSDQ